MSETPASELIIDGGGGPRYVFVIAPARSGTTALSHILASHLDFRCSPETNVMGILHRVGRDHPAMTFGEFQRRQPEFLMHGARRPYSLVFPRNLLGQRILNDPRAFAEVLLAADHYSTGAHILEQTPRNGEHATALRWLFPEAILIFLVRNPFDVIQSNRATPWGTANPFILFAIWARQYVEMVRLSRFYGREQLMILRYEKLSQPDYRAGMLRRLERAGIARRAAPIEIVPRNFAGTSWAVNHLAQTVQEFGPKTENKWSRRHPWLGRLGAGLCLISLRAMRSRQGKGHGPRWALLELAALFTVRVLKR